MLLTHNYKFIFFRVPKTGSSSIATHLQINTDARTLGKFKRNLNNVYGNRATDDELKSWKKIKEETTNGDNLIIDKNHSEFKVYTLLSDYQTCKNYFKFSFVRNPWDRIVSRYIWEIENDGKFMSTKESTKINKFSDYIHNLHMDTWKPFVCSQYEFTAGCDFIGKFENLQQDFNTICDKIGIPQQQLPHKNKSKRNHYTEYYDDETCEIVAERYAKDIEYFGYTYGE